MDLDIWAHQNNQMSIVPDTEYGGWVAILWPMEAKGSNPTEAAKNLMHKTMLPRQNVKYDENFFEIKQ